MLHGKIMVKWGIKRSKMFRRKSKNWILPAGPLSEVPCVQKVLVRPGGVSHLLLLYQSMVNVLLQAKALEQWTPPTKDLSKHLKSHGKHSRALADHQCTNVGTTSNRFHQLRSPIRWCFVALPSAGPVAFRCMSSAMKWLVSWRITWTNLLHPYRSSRGAWKRSFASLVNSA